jgi:thioredoxin domain-containing protein 10
MIVAELANNSGEMEFLNASMSDWINAERFATFPKITRGNINQLLQTRKYLVLAIVEENKLLEIPTEMLV